MVYELIQNNGPHYTAHSATGRDEPKSEASVLLEELGRARERRGEQSTNGHALQEALSDEYRRVAVRYTEQHAGGHKGQSAREKNASCPRSVKRCPRGQCRHEGCPHLKASDPGDVGPTSQGSAWSLVVIVCAVDSERIGAESERYELEDEPAYRLWGR